MNNNNSSRKKLKTKNIHSKKTQGPENSRHRELGTQRAQRKAETKAKRKVDLGRTSQKNI